ncbi:MAG: DNA repair protein RecN [Prevotella sp.]|nr:DNA repair protein RecN [Prevotella sp.]
MLQQLYIKNFTIIDTLDICFNPGFSVITGETGAGKSIILGAIGMLLGQRADAKSIKPGCDKCVIEAHFNINGYQMQSFFEDNDIDYDADDCIMRRELNSSGKSRAFINDVPVPLSTMRLLGQQLLDIHSQHRNLLLNEEDFQLNVVDIIAGNKDILDDYRKKYAEYTDASKAVAQMKKNIEESKQNEDYMRFQLKELSEASLETGIQQILETECEKLNHVEEIKSALYTADNLLNEDNGGNILGNIKELSRTINGITNIYNDVKELSERIEACYIEMKDISQELGTAADMVDFDPVRLQQVSERLDKIYSLQQKYHVSTVEELMVIQTELVQKLSEIDNSDDLLTSLEAKERQSLSQCMSIADKLTASREAAATKIEKEMRKLLVPLGIPNVQFAVNIGCRELCLTGKDSVSFLFCANKGGEMQPVTQVASGGEIARVMLSIKAMISGAVKLPTIIFDEIDTGVSGKIAEKMANIMLDMSKSERQVISITHLPQIAAKGQTHYKVYKEEDKQGTTSRMTMLGCDERVKEIAQMLSGAEITDAAISNARELLNVN